MARKIMRTTKKTPEKKSVKTQKKVVKKKNHRRKASSDSVELTQFIVPAALGFLLTWLLSRSMYFGGVVFFAVLVGSWFGQTYKNKK